jgi:hypothetical protein
VQVADDHAAQKAQVVDVVYVSASVASRTRWHSAPGADLFTGLRCECVNARLTARILVVAFPQITPELIQFQHLMAPAAGFSY